MDSYPLPKLIFLTDEKAEVGSLRRHRLEGLPLRSQDGKAIGSCFAVGDRYQIHLSDLARYTYDRGRHTISVVEAPPFRRQSVIEQYWRTVLPLVLQVLGNEIIHASAIRLPNGVSAFCGSPMAGKSTIAFGLGRHGCGFWADDIVVFGCHEETIRSIRLPCRSSLRPDAKRFFADSVAENEVTYPKEPSAFAAESAPIVALFALKTQDEQRCNESWKPTRLSKARAFSAVATHMCYFGIDDVLQKRRIIQHYLSLVASVPVYQVSIPRGFESFDSGNEALIELCRAAGG